MALNIQKRYSNFIIDKNKLEEIFSLTEEDCCKLSTCMNFFGEFNGKRKFNAYDLISVPPGIYGKEGKKNKNTFTTTVGLYFFNKAFIERELFDLFGYINKPITKKQFGKLNEKLGYAVIEDDIPLDVMKRFIIKTQKFQPYCNILSWSFDEAMLGLSHELDSYRKELCEKYKEGLDAADPTTGQLVEEKLLQRAKELLKDDPSFDMIESGSKISFGNNFKNIFCMRGACKMSDPSKGDYMMFKNSYIDGIGKEDYDKFADSLVGGPYARAKKTETGGALEKLFVRAFQHITLGPKDSDCGTKRTYEVTLTDKNIQLWMYNYIVEGNNLVELTSKNRDKYLGKTVKFRFSIYCEDPKHICNKCGGNLFYRIGIKNVGIAAFAMCSKIKNISMKAFHDSTVKVAKMENYGFDKIFGKDINAAYSAAFKK